MTKNYNFNDPSSTIAAIATPSGEGAISIIRLSGKKALEITTSLFTKDLTKVSSHTAYYGKISDSEGLFIDSVLVLVMKNPKSYTGEDIVEINAHGSSLIAKKILKALLDKGAKAALPGEFTMRAFLNGKIDLSQAEAVQSLIAAKNELTLKAEEKQLAGDLYKEINGLQKELTSIAAVVEAWIDFPEEDLDLEKIDLKQKLNKSLLKMKKLLSSYETGKMISSGLNLTIIGTPNVGKSSLMNALLKKEKAIVTDIAGTTRDLLESPLKLNQLHFHLIDTAGIRKTDELIEKEGIKRSYKALKEAEISLLVIDASHELSDDDKELLNLIDENKTIVILNKIDLSKKVQSLKHKHQIEISLKDKTNFDALVTMIENLALKYTEINQGSIQDEIIITKERHQKALQEAVDFAQKALLGIDQMNSFEFVSSDLQFSLRSLGKIIGQDISEDLLSEIFANFCIGK